MTCCEHNPPPSWSIAALWFLMVLAVLCALSGCAHRAAPLPRTVEVAIPVPVPCEVKQVPAANHPQPEATMGLFDLVKTLLADRQVTTGENERLRAANETACKEPSQ